MPKTAAKLKQYQVRKQDLKRRWQKIEVPNTRLPQAKPVDYQPWTKNTNRKHEVAT